MPGLRKVLTPAMSESVRFFLEGRVPELEDLFKKGIFSKDEIKEIVAKRTKFEHKIKRRGAILEDFLGYIQYEIDLEHTRKQRYEMLEIRAKHSISDHSIVKYILSLYRRAVTKFRGNMKLWDDYISFARDSKSDKSMPKILASALQMHSEAVDIWIKAASWELNHLNNPASARALFLRAIRINKESKTLWFEYFRMELEVANALAKSKFEISEGIDEIKSELTVFEGAIAISVFKHAVKEIFLDSKSAYEYYRLSSEYANLKGVSEFIQNFVVENMANPNVFYVLQASAEVSLINFDDEKSIASIENCMSLLNKALKCGASSATTSDVIEVLKKVLEKSNGHVEIKSMVSEKISHIFEAGERLNILTPEHYLTWINVSKEFSDCLDFEKIICRALLRFPENLSLLQAKISCACINTEIDVLVLSLSSLIKSSPEKCVHSLDSLFEKFFDLDNDKLMQLAVLSVSNFIPSTQAIRYILNQKSESELISMFEHSAITADFTYTLMMVFIEKKCFGVEVKKFVSKLSIFSSKAFSKKEPSLALIQFALTVGDIELSNRLYSKIISSLPLVMIESFLHSFEGLKESINVFMF